MFFDNLTVSHIRGPILEETQYYPFGLTMAGISSKALAFGNPQNRYKFNDGTELTNQEFSDGSGLELYETPFRGYDPQIGRFWQIDDMAEVFDEYSPYIYAYNNPIAYNDPTGLFAEDPEPAENGGKVKELSEVIVVSRRKPAPAVLTVSNSPGTQFKPNPDYKPFEQAGRNNPKYIPVQTRCDPGCTLHDHMTEDEFNEVAITIFTAGIPGTLIFKFFRWAYVASNTKRAVGAVKVAIGARRSGQGFKSLGAAGKGFSEVLQKGGQAIKNSTWKRLGIDPIKGSEAIHKLKDANSLKPNFHGKIMGNGDYLHPQTSEFIDNIFDYLH